MVVRGGRYFALCFFKKYTLDHYCQGVLKWKNHVHRDIFSHRSHLKLSLSKGGRYYALCFSSSKYTSNQYCQSVLTWILMPIAINFPTDRTSTIVVKRRQVLHALCFFHQKYTSNHFCPYVLTWKILAHRDIFSHRSYLLTTSTCYNFVNSRYAADAAKPRTKFHFRMKNTVPLLELDQDRARSQIKNDPSAGSPTETLLRLLLPLSDKVWPSLTCTQVKHRTCRPPKASPDHSIGRSDGRCVQRAGTYSARDDDPRLQGIPRSRGKVASLYPHHERI